MTSQIVLFNGYGVALASDSAITMGGERVYDTAEKILPLPSPHQMAVLTSGAAMLCGYPYGLLLGEWARSLDGERFGSAREYGLEFLQWLRSSALFADQQELACLREHVDILCRSVRTEIIQRAHEKNNQGHEWSDSDSVRVVQAQLRIYKNQAILYNADGSELTEVLGSYANEFHDWIKVWFDDIPWCAQADVVMKKTISAYLLRSMWMGELRTVLAFVGMGENEMMASYFELDIRGVMAGRPLGRFQIYERFSPSDTVRYSGYHFLGQCEAIQTFVDGIDRGAYSRTTAIVGDTVTKVREILQQRGVDGNLLEESFRQLDQSVPDDMEKRLGVVDKRTVFSDVLAGLPAASLVSVARSLIGVQSLSQAVKAELNTVGGPIDTAVITRKGGFSWVHHQSKEN